LRFVPREGPLQERQQRTPQTFPIFGKWILDCRWHFCKDRPCDQALWLKIP